MTVASLNQVSGGYCLQDKCKKIGTCLISSNHRLLNVDSDRRMTVDELLNSAWLNDVEPNDNIDLHDSGIMRNPVQFLLKYI